MSNDNLQLHRAAKQSSPGYSQSIHDPSFDDCRLRGPESKTAAPNTVLMPAASDIYSPTATSQLAEFCQGESKAFQRNQSHDELDFTLLELAFADVEPQFQSERGDLDLPPDEPVNPHFDLSQYDRITQELIKKDGRGEALTREERVKLESLSFESPIERELYQKLMLGKISRREKAIYIGIQEFNPSFDNNPEPSELVTKEVLGTITREESASLHAYREFRYDNQARQRELSAKEFLNSASPLEQAELNSWREFPLARFGRARVLVVKEQTSGLTPAEKTELAAEREKPRIPIHGAFSIVAGGDKPKAPPPGNGPRSERVKEIAKREFPDNLKGQELVCKYMNGKLTPTESAVLNALRGFPCESIPRQLQEKEVMGTIKPVEKAYLSACREFPSHLPGAPEARRLAALETNDAISAHDAAVLAAHREFSGLFMGLDVPVPKDAVALAAQEREGTIGGVDARRLAQVRIEYKTACNKAMQESLPPPPPPEPTPPAILNAPQPPTRRN